MKNKYIIIGSSWGVKSTKECTIKYHWEECICSLLGIWGQPAKDDLAEKWLNMIPDRAYNLVQNHKLPAGARLVSVESEIATPGFKEFTPSWVGMGVRVKHQFWINTKYTTTFLWCSRCLYTGLQSHASTNTCTYNTCLNISTNVKI